MRWGGESSCELSVWRWGDGSKQAESTATKAKTENSKLEKKIQSLERELAIRQKALENAAEFARENIDLAAEREKAKYARIIAQQSITDASVQIEKSHKKRDEAIRELEERVAQVVAETSALQVGSGLSFVWVLNKKSTNHHHHHHRAHFFPRSLCVVLLPEQGQARPAERPGKCAPR